jgi:hypothetical protein
MAPIVVAALLVGFLALVWWLSKGGEKLVAERNAKLRAQAAANGLEVEPQDDAMRFVAKGTTPTGLELSLRVDRVDVPGHGTRWLYRVIARPKRPLSPVVMRLRRRAEPTEDGGPRLHERATGDAEFDARFVTRVETDSASASIVERARAAIDALGATPIGGVESFSAGAEVSLAFDCSFDTKLFEDGRADAMVASVIAIASGR